MDHVSIGALLFLSAGTLDWHQGWIFMAVFVIGGLAVTLWVGVARSRIAQRAHGRTIPKGPSDLGQGIHFIIVIWFSSLVLMALDAKRWKLSHMPGALNYAGVVLIPIGFLIV